MHYYGTLHGTPLFFERLEQMPKNIVICCDGTGNQFGECNSNVVKLYTALMINNDQVGYYHPGLGTMGSPTERTHLGKAWSKLKGLAFGGGFFDNIEDAYQYLMNQYNDGDQIYLIGFSRGAYTARALGAILHAFGLLCKGNEGHFPYVLRMFMDGTRKMRRQNKRTLPVDKAFKETFSHNVTLRFVGVWDTVSSIGWIYEPIKLLYSAHNPSIQTGRHAMSIDERRCFYVDNLWGPSLAKEHTPDLEAEQDILQVWFAGVHSDVGGSYPQQESALANRALQWILGEAIAAGIKVVPERVDMIFGRETKTEYAAAGLFRRPLEPGSPHESLSGAWWLLEFLPHRYYDKDDEKERWRIPIGRPRQIPDTAFIHPSAVEQMEDRSCNYRPTNLKRDKILPFCEVSRDVFEGGTGTKADLSEFHVYLSHGLPAGTTKIPKTGAVAGLVALAGVGLELAIFKK
jgi:uncharacterized protein (DUF2235 family)